MRQWVLSFPFLLRFLFASKPAVMGKVLGIVYRTIATHLAHKGGFAKPMAQTGAVTLIQRFGSALNLNIHYHMLFLDGVYIEDKYGTSRFRRVKAPTSDELSKLTHTIAQRVGCHLERRGLLESDTGTNWLRHPNLRRTASRFLICKSLTQDRVLSPVRFVKPPRRVM